MCGHIAKIQGWHGRIYGCENRDFGQRDKIKSKRITKQPKTKQTKK